MRPRGIKVPPGCAVAIASPMLIFVGLFQSCEHLKLSTRGLEAEGTITGLVYPTKGKPEVHFVFEDASGERQKGHTLVSRSKASGYRKDDQVRIVYLDEKYSVPEIAEEIRFQGLWAVAIGLLLAVAFGAREWRKSKEGGTL